MIFERTILQEKRLYHYCKISTAIKHILKTKTLRLGSILDTNDPIENKTLCFQYGMDEDRLENFDSNNYNQVISKILREDCKLVCFSKDYEKIKGCHLSRMWYSYASNHKGICLELCKDKLIEKNEKLLPKLIMDNVNYLNFDVHRPMRHKRIFVNGNNFLADKECIRKEFRSNYLAELYFTKSIEWKSESEFRFIFFDKKNKDRYLNIDGSLVKIHLGINFNFNHLNTIKKLIGTFKSQVEIRKTEFLNEGLVSRYL